MTLSRFFRKDFRDEPIDPEETYYMTPHMPASTGSHLITGKDLLRIADWLDQQETEAGDA